MAPTTELEAKTYVEKLSEYESQGYNLVRLRQAKNNMLADLKKAALAIDIKNFRNTLYTPILDKTPLAELLQYFYSDALSIDDWVRFEINGLKMAIDANTSYIDGIKKKKKLSAADQKTIKFWEQSISKDEENIKRIKNALMARKKIAPVIKETPENLSRDEIFKEQVVNTIKDHADKIRAILLDYVVTDGAELEIEQALSSLSITTKMLKC